MSVHFPVFTVAARVQLRDLRNASMVTATVALVTAACVGSASAAMSEKECKSYSDEAISLVKRAEGLQCGFNSPPGRWSDDYLHHFQWCMGLQDADRGYIVSELNARYSEIAKCEKAAANHGNDGGNDGGGNGGASANQSTDIYKKPDGVTSIHVLQQNDPVTIVTCRDDQWCQLSKPVNGWVWGEHIDR